MKKSIIICAALLALVSCKHNDAEVKNENTVVEGPKDTAHLNTESDIPDPVQPETTSQVEAPAVGEKKAEKTEVIKANEPVKAALVDYASFGDRISADKALTKEQMLKKYSSLKSGDTINVKFTTHINDVCKKKGCWMSLELPGGKESFVKFKDYAFFVPLNAAGQDAVVSGKAFVSEISVAQLRHYAKDGGKSEEEIAKITKPEVTYGFLADGVLISK